MLDNDNLAETPDTETTEVPETETEVKNKPDSSEGENKDAPTESDDAEGKAEKKELTETEKVKAAMQKRIDRQTAQRFALQRQLDELRAQIPQPQKVDDAPKEADFNSYEDYLIAKGKHEAKKEYEAKISEAENAKIEKAYKERVEAGRQDFVIKEAEFRKAVPDYDDAVEVLNEAIQSSNHNSTGFQVFKDVMLAAPDLPALSYHLGKNPELIEELQKMEPAKLAWKLIETALGLKKPKSESKQLPNPPKPLKEKGAPSKNLSGMSGKQVVAWLKAK